MTTHQPGIDLGHVRVPSGYKLLALGVTLGRILVVAMQWSDSSNEFLDYSDLFSGARITLIAIGSALLIVQVVAFARSVRVDSLPRFEGLFWATTVALFVLLIVLADATPGVPD